MAVSKNVYELAQERLELIFKEFDTICVSFSGGKDSGVLLNLCIDYIRRNNLKRKLCVFHMDYEIQYTVTIDYVDRILEANKDILEVYRVCVPFKVTTCTSMYQSYWRPWDEYEGALGASDAAGLLYERSVPFLYGENVGLRIPDALCQMAAPAERCGAHLFPYWYPHAGKLQPLAQYSSEP